MSHWIQCYCHLELSLISRRRRVGEQKEPESSILGNSCHQAVRREICGDLPPALPVPAAYLSSTQLLPATFFTQASKLATDLQSTFEKFLSEFHLVNIFLLFKGFKPHPAGHLFAQFFLVGGPTCQILSKILGSSPNSNSKLFLQTIQPLQGCISCGILVSGI